MRDAKNILWKMLWVLFLIVPPATSQDTCDVGWFGQNCQYKCHQTNYRDCTGDCVPGWFGPDCQYADLMSTHATSTRLVLRDGKHTTCITYLNLQSVTLSLTQAFPFTWMRLGIKSDDLDSLLGLKVQLQGSNSQEVLCNNMRKIPYNSKILDVYCDGDVAVQSITLTGDGVKSLCTVNFSGGRNVALKEAARQSSDYTERGTTYVAALAVDGNTGNDFYLYKSCTATNHIGDSERSWRVDLSQPRMVNRYVLYNRKGNTDSRLQGFSLRSYAANKTQLFQHQDQETAPQAMYTLLVTSVGNIAPVSYVVIKARSTAPLLTLCEVEIYGDSVCKDGMYGRECSDTCSSTCETTENICEVSTGACSQCQPGMTGYKCDLVCPSTYQGSHCQERCSTNCVDQICNGQTGYCINCPRGKQGNLCDQDCESGKYGAGCSMSCNNCKNMRCDPVYGECKNGCEDGYKGWTCEEVCDFGKYGAGCNGTCNTFCKSGGTTEAFSPCHHVSGTCVRGCETGYFGEKCDATMPIDEREEPVSLGAIIGAVTGAIVAIALIVGGILLWRRRRGRKNSTSNKNDNGADSGVRSMQDTVASSLRLGTDQHGNPDEVVTAASPGNGPKINKSSEDADYYNARMDSKSTAIPVSHLQNFVKTQPKDFYEKQFKGISENKSATTNTGKSNENRAKNRYNNICAYDHSRVHLHINKDKGHGDYINASYLEGYKEREKFIASQGPTKLIIEDFVRMLWEQKVNVVVMLTNLMEQGKQKCEQYWPLEGEIRIGEIKIKLTTTDVFADYTIRRLCLSKEGENGYLLTQFHFTSWPDKDVPTTPWGLVDFEQKVDSTVTDKPIVVHCSAGVGRTGTFIALRNVMKEAEDTGYVDFFTTVQKLRNDRINMVQTASQYEFLHQAAQVAIVCMGSTVTSSDIQKRIDKLDTTSSSGETLMQREFRAICAVCYDEDDATSVRPSNTKDTYVNTIVDNKLKDRLKNVPAKENYRPHLSCENDDMESYINAVFVPSFRKKDGQLLSQLPLPTTGTYFWRLVTQYKVSLVVAFELDLKEKDSSIGDYLPKSKEDTLAMPPFRVSVGSLTEADVFEKQTVTVTADKTSEGKKAPALLKGEHRLVHLKARQVDLTPDNLLALIKQIRSHNRGDKGRTVYLCRNGATYSGLVCVLTLLLDRMDHDLCLTVPLVVGEVKSIRPQVIPTLEHYKLLYQVLHLYSETNNVYGNLGQSTGGDAGASAPRNEPDEADKDTDRQVYANF